MSRALLALLFLPLAAALAAASCQDYPPLQTCGEIPADGCPVGRGGTCDDVTCSALWDCVNGAWVHVQTCNNPEGGAQDGDAGRGDAGPVEAGTCTPVTIDMSGKTTDCTPDLMDPDCPVEAAEGCAETACVTGCADFYLCTNEGWIDVAYCTDDGQLVVTRP